MKKTVVITGASRGIGAKTAEVFASHGYDVFLNYLNNHEKAQKLKQELEEKYHQKIILIPCDVKDETSVIKMTEQIKSQVEKIDCLVNNAAIAKDDFPTEKNAEEFLEVLSTNTVSIYNTCKYIGGWMYEQKQGTIINISSTNAFDTYATYSMDYDASKAATVSLTKNFAVHYAPYVRVNSVAPGWTNTESVFNMNPEDRKKETKKILLERFANPEEIAKVIYFLASEEASYINSEIIRVDGGYYQK